MQKLTSVELSALTEKSVSCLVLYKKNSIEATTAKVRVCPVEIKPPPLSLTAPHSTNITDPT